ncbi:MAG: hypothetical protein R6U50_05780 [Desulfobacterales bacterium]
MGKNSLLKPTAKKKKTSKKNAGPAGKSSKTPVSPAKKKSVKTAAKAPTKSAKKGKNSRTAKQSENILFRKFDGFQPVEVYTPPARRTEEKRYASPPFVTGDTKASERVGKLLLKKFDMASLEAAAEKAAAEKAAAEKAAAEKAASQQFTTPPFKSTPPDQNISISYSGNKDVKPPDIQDRMMKIAAVVFAFLVFALIGASFSHYRTYYLQHENGAVTIWKGKFAPMGKTFLISLPGAEIPENMKTQGSKNTIFPFVAEHYLEQADNMIETQDIPDFKAISNYLEQAAPYAVTAGLQNRISTRSTTINLMALLYKSEVAAGSETVEGYEKALDYLESAKRLPLDLLQREWVQKKMQTIEASLNPPAVQGPQTEPPAPAAVLSP